MIIPEPITTVIDALPGQGSNSLKPHSGRPISPPLKRLKRAAVQGKIDHGWSYSRPVCSHEKVC